MSLRGKITKRKKAKEVLAEKEAFLSNILDSIRDGISIINVSDLRIVKANAAFMQDLGLKEGDVIGNKCYEVTHNRVEPCAPPNDVCPLISVIETGKQAMKEHIHYDGEGRELYVEVYAYPIKGKDGKVDQVVHVSRDISRRKQAEDEIRRLNADLELKVEERTSQLLEAREELVRKEKLAILGQLSGSVGHELRNPLGVMSNAVYFLEMVLTDADETIREYLDIIKHEIDNSQRIISDLLDFARTKTPQTKTVSIRQLLDESLGKCSIPENVELRTMLPDPLPPLKVDPRQMVQVLQNLLTNAVQAMPSGGALKISARRERGTRNEERGNQDLNLEPRTSIPDPRFSNPDPRTSILDPKSFNLEPRTSILEPDFIEISIEDTGAGISEENMRKLFQPLFTTKAGGIGLGLVVCKNLVETNGGRIEVESELGKGTTFTLLLPVEVESS